MPRYLMFKLGLIYGLKHCITKTFIMAMFYAVESIVFSLVRQNGFDLNIGLSPATWPVRRVPYADCENPISKYMLRIA